MKIWFRICIRSCNRNVLFLLNSLFFKQVPVMKLGVTQIIWKVFYFQSFLSPVTLFILTWKKKWCQRKNRPFMFIFAIILTLNISDFATFFYLFSCWINNFQKMSLHLPPLVFQLNRIQLKERSELLTCKIKKKENNFNIKSMRLWHWRNTFFITEHLLINPIKSQKTFLIIEYWGILQILGKVN